VRPLAEPAFHASGEADCRFPKLVAQMVRGGKSLLPTLLLRGF
jgi:hypothetical protein